MLTVTPKINIGPASRRLDEFLPKHRDQNRLKLNSLGKHLTFSVKSVELRISWGIQLPSGKQT